MFHIFESIVILFVGIAAGIGLVSIFDKDRVLLSGKRLATSLADLQDKLRQKKEHERALKNVQKEIRELKASRLQHIDERNKLEVIFTEGQDPPQSSNRVNADEAIVFGRGEEWVYLYTFPVHENLARERKEAMYPMKLGMTTQDDVVTRINQQVSGNSTALSERATLRLAFRVNDSGDMEKWMHKKLESRSGGKVANSIGTEWFNTNPQDVAQLFREYVLQFDRHEHSVVE